ncbi:MAG: putative glycoside hydrolase [Acidimicrobiales bacterium]
MQQVYRRRRMVALVVVLAALVSVWWLASTVAGLVRQVPVEVKGLNDGRLGAAAAAAPEIRVPGGATRVEVDGAALLATAERDGSRVLVRPRPLGEGQHKVSVSVGRALRPDRSRTLVFTVDAVPPAVTAELVGAVEPGKGVVVEGTAEKGATLRSGTTKIDVRDGRYKVEVPAPAPAEVVITATDQAGNEGTARVAIASVQPPTRAVHMSALAWVTPVLRDPIMELLDQGRINAIQLDVKDEGGEVGHTSKVPLAREIGAAKDRFVLKDAVDDIHRRKGRVIARIVTLRDPKLAQASWDAGRREDLVQAPDGERFGAYGGGFLNSVSPRVRDYTTALAVEAAEAGADDILLDYIRRPDGNIDGMVFPGLKVGDSKEKAIEDAVVKQVTELQNRVRASGSRLGASVYGISASRPQEIAQDIPRLAQHLDFVSPMLYPSHWGKGEYGIADPNRSPGPITTKALDDFQEAIKGSPAALVPWFQDFTLGVSYGETEVRAQLDAAAELGVKDFLLWDAQCTYTAAALDRQQS